MGTATVAHIVTVDVEHVGVFLGDQVGDVLQQPAAIDRRDHHVHFVAATGLAPFHRQDPLWAGGSQAGQRRTVCPMHGDTTATGAPGARAGAATPARLPAGWPRARLPAGRG
ncbi:hypothetical protein G6F66_014867 [Rhizopus arrhizus]|nr:hypothetical protein G6F66_014867 [Rhizopus arrhizus]